MRLTLDHDSEAIHELHYPDVKRRVVEEQATLATFLASSDLTFQGRYERWRSSGGEGYHYVEPGLPPSVDELQQLRQDFGDDQLRISLDAERVAQGSPFYQVLYHLKSIRPTEQPPYRTGDRAVLLERDGFGPAYDYDASDTIIKWREGDRYRLDYQAVLRQLRDHPDFGSAAAVYRHVVGRSSVELTTEPRKRAYDVLHGRRPPNAAEKKALRDYAMSRDLGHYQDGEATEPASPPDAPEHLPRRTTFHEYFSVPDLTGPDGTPFGADEGESTWLPANLRVGSYAGHTEAELKAVLDRMAPTFIDLLNPMDAIDLNRLRDGISLERERWLDQDEVAVNRQTFFQNQPAQDEDPDGPPPTSPEQLRDAGVDPFDGVLWELIIYDEDYTTPPWLVVRGVIPEGGGLERPLTNSYIVADTKGWATSTWGATP